MVPVSTPNPATPTAITINNAQNLMKQVQGSQGGQSQVKGQIQGQGSSIPIQLNLSISPASQINSQGLLVCGIICCWRNFLTLKGCPFVLKNLLMYATYTRLQVVF